MNNHMRDTQLDHYRALMMMHVIIGHVMYWLYAAGEPYLSFVLFAMAGTFFIALSCARMFPVHPSEPTSGSCSPTSS